MLYLMIASEVQGIPCTSCYRSSCTHWTRAVVGTLFATQVPTYLLPTGTRLLHAAG